MSLMIESRVFPALLISRAYFLILLSLASRRIISSMPSMPLSGVRISCDIFARKSSLALLVCASSFASSLMPINCFIVWIIEHIMKPKSPIAMKSPENTPLCANKNNPI